MPFRFTAIFPAICCIAALVLAFLCLFAGHKKDFMEDYHVLTLNTSRIGYNLVNVAAENSDPLSNVLENLPSNIREGINEVAGSIAQELGVDDFYSVHLLDYCWGDYTPGPLPNATLSRDDIHKNVTACSPRKANFHFEPKEIIEEKLNATGTGITLDQLNWPDDIQKGIDALHIIQTTAFALYCVAIGLIFISLIAMIPALFASGRLAACLNVLVAAFAFLAIGLASALMTAVIVKGSEVINQHGAQIGLEAHRGMKFLTLTWVATALMLVALLLWCFEACIGHRKRQPYAAKHG